MADWTTADVVRERIRQATAAAGWDDTEIGLRMARGQDHLKTALTPIYGQTQVALWDTIATRPDLIEELNADQAAVFIYQDAYGQNPLEPGTPGGNLQASIDAVIEKLKAKAKLLVLDDGTPIYPVEIDGVDGVESTTRNREPTFTQNRQTQNELEPGSLDGF